MPRALWSGSLSFGLVNVPVQLVSAVRDLDYHFHELHEKDKVRIEHRRFCSEEDVEVLWEEIAHAHDLDGKQVIVTDAELGSVQPRKTRTIGIEAFVDLTEVDPLYFDHPYFLVPAGESEGTLRAYRLLVEVLDRQGQVALGRFVMRTKEYLAAVRARDGALALTTMRFHDEVRPTGELPGGGKKPSAPAGTRAQSLRATAAGSSTRSAATSCTSVLSARASTAARRCRRKSWSAPCASEADAAPSAVAALVVEADLERLMARTRERRAPGGRVVAGGAAAARTERRRARA